MTFFANANLVLAFVSFYTGLLLSGAMFVPLWSMEYLPYLFLNSGVLTGLAGSGLVYILYQAFFNQNLNASVDPDYEIVEAGSSDIFSYPFVHMTGHGNVVFSDAEARNLREYLQAGGFLHIDDNYGMDQYIRLEIKKIFPELDFIEIPHNHHIYNNIYKFGNGLPKIHEHDNKPPQGLALIYNGRIVCFYSYESDLGDGWEDKNVHNDPEHIRQEALKMGANIIAYAMNKKR